MKLIKLFAASVAILGALAASQSAQAHARFNVGTGGTPVWTGSAVTEWMPSNVDVPSIGYLGIHSATNARVIQTGIYNKAYNATTFPTGVPTNDPSLGGAMATPGGNINATAGDTLRGQIFAANMTQNAATQKIAVGANSWVGAENITATTAGLSWGNIHTSGTGTSGNPELDAMTQTTNPFQFLNITIADDILDNALNTTQNLAFALYQGWANGPGLSGLNLLYSGASVAGEDIGVTLALTGNSLNGPAHAAEYTIVVGDQSGIGGQYRLGLQASNTAAYSTVVAAVPVPGAVWLFGSAMAGLIGFGRRKAAVAA